MESGEAEKINARWEHIEGSHTFKEATLGQTVICPQYDGQRCRLGWEPGWGCVPWMYPPAE